MEDSSDSRGKRYVPWTFETEWCLALQTNYQTAADNGDRGETIPIQAIQMPMPIDLTSDDGLLPQRATPQLSVGTHGTNNIPNQPLEFQVQSDDVRLPEHANTGRLQHSSRKRKQTATDNGDRGQTIPIQAIQISIPMDLTSDDGLLPQRATPQLSVGMHGTNNMPNQPMEFQVQSDDVPLPEHANTGGLQRSSRKRKQTAADNGDRGETIPIQAIQISIPMDLTSDDGLLPQRATPQLSVGTHGTNNMPNQPLEFQVQSDDVHLPEHANTGGLRRSSRKRKQVSYYEEEITFARKQPRNARKKPSKG